MTRRRKNDMTPTIRCAVYTRKSTEEGLDQEFNTLDAQRESGEAYIKSQPGWQCLPDHYDDGGFTGGNMDRPALRRLMAEIEAGHIDCVVVYKVDRLSRSLMDFARIVEVFDRHNVSFVSVTQQFNTATSMGRLILNVLLSFAQFEREMIGERTRDKIAATRRKGKWAGGTPILGYNVVNKKLVIDEAEAGRVREIFDLYIGYKSLIATAQELNRRGWRGKVWITKKGRRMGGLTFDKAKLHQLLTNVAYIGKIRHKTEVYEGEHEAIVDKAVFDRVQKLLKRNGQNGGKRYKSHAMLGNVLRLAACGCAMSHAFTSKGNRRYRYYVCNNAQKTGWESCPAPSVPAGELERFVVNEIKAIGQDPGLVAATFRETRRQVEEGIGGLRAEERRLVGQLRDKAEIHQGGDDFDHLADLLDRVRRTENRVLEIRGEIEALGRDVVTEDEAAGALAEFDAVWEALKPRERNRVIELLIETIDFDGSDESVSLTFRPAGIRVLEEAMG